ncbi:MAG: DUF4385 domain-containing protein [Proteobacteria bacterium]|nr:MAG: DUF4385 domain-containing protein [Pseudomonadota bacterium]
MGFNYDQDFKHINFRKHPELYQVGKGEQGVLSVEPYKSEILPHWRFKDPDIARESASYLYGMFLGYKDCDDFVGMDMARKFLQMGFTRARRYANHSSGRKYKEGTREILPIEVDEVKAESASIFYKIYHMANEDQHYLERRKIHKEKYG